MVEEPIVLPLVWRFATNSLPQPLQNLTVNIASDCLTRGYEFLVDNVEKNDQHGLNIAANLTRIFRPRWTWRLPLRRLLLSLSVKTTHPCFITGYDVMILDMKLGPSLACCLSPMQIKTRWVFWLSPSSLGTNLAEMRLMFKLSTKMRWTVPYDSPTISQTSWIVCLRSARIASRTFAVFRCCACRRSSRTLIVVDRGSSILQAFVP